MKRFEKKKKKKIPVITCQQKQASPLNITQTERTSASAFAGQPSPGYLPTVFPLVFFASNARSVPLRRFGTLALTVREQKLGKKGTVGAFLKKKGEISPQLSKISTVNLEGRM